VGGLTIDQALEELRQQLHLSKETEHEVLEEIRTHLEDVVAEAKRRGEDDQVALRKAVDQFGLEEAGSQLQEVHAGRESVDAIIATALPVLFTLALRWLVFAPDGSAVAWHQLLTKPGFWLVAGLALLLPLVTIRRWRFALLGWGIFWLLTVIFVIFPSLIHW
jgi:hypothetical protein